MNETNIDYKNEIIRLKTEKNALVLAHYYQPLEIQELADFTGDSFDLSLKAKEAKNQIIVFCGVSFMAETVKILSPQKQVLNPNPAACCPMADMIGQEQIIQLRKKYPDAAVVCYINTMADVKAVSDVCVTSSTALKIVNKLKEDTIIFVPDKNLANYVQRNTQKKIIPVTGYCYVHNRFQHVLLKQAKMIHPGAKVIVHPECPPDVIDLADVTLSTSGMLKYVAESSATEFIIGTEHGLIVRMQNMYPEKKFFSIGPPGVCMNMKKIKLHDLYIALKENVYEVTLPEEVIQKAGRCLDRMIELSK